MRNVLDRLIYVNMWAPRWWQFRKAAGPLGDGALLKDLHCWGWT